MDKFEGLKQQLEKDLSDDKKPWTKYLKLAEEKTNLPRIYIFGGSYEFFLYICENLYLSLITKRKHHLKD